MTNLEKYNSAFIENFSLKESMLIGLKYQDISEWDSIGHMGLIAVIEDSFNIMMETDDIIDFSDYEKGKTILQKYGIII
ncbi:MAG: acyl carrier protein [Ruminiclostridium sp.]